MTSEAEPDGETVVLNRVGAGPAYRGERLCPLPVANRSNLSSDKQPTLTRSGHKPNLSNRYGVYQIGDV